MIKSKLLVFLLLFVLAITGCSSIKRMNNNLEESIQSVNQNTHTVQRSSEVIAKNTEEISNSTTTMKIYFPLFLVIVLAVLLYPTFILIKLQHKLSKDMRALVKKFKK